MKVRITIIVASLFLFTGIVHAEQTFFVDSSYDKHGRSEIEVRLEKTTNKIHFFVETSWWEDLTEEKRREYGQEMIELGKEFEDNVYNQMTSLFGKEPSHRVSSDDRISVLFHQMSNSSGGYFNSADQYSIYQIKHSNERNLLYLNANLMKDPHLPGYLGHEFMHLITFARKNRDQGVTEEIWLNELRAEYMPTFLGYDEEYEDSNLQRRMERFLNTPNASLTEWTNATADYGVVAAFGQYLVDHYGVEILEKSLKSGLVGIQSIDYALDSLGYDKMFSDVFREWVIAVYVNDCSMGEYYCYKSENLEDINVRPKTNFLPISDKGSIVVEHGTKNWAGNWHRIVGGQGTLSFRFHSEGRIDTIPYILCIEEIECSIEFMDVGPRGRAELVIDEFSNKYSSFTILPFMHGKYEGFNGPERTHYFSWEAEIKKEVEEDKEKRLRELKAQLQMMKEQLAHLQAKLAAREMEGLLCDRISNNLGFGMMNSREVACLQQFLKAQSVYPEGIISGNFLTLTRAAVIRLQERHRREILSPFGLDRGTGYVGPSTRSFINSIISK